MSARKSASLFYDGLVAGFVGGATVTDDGRKRGSCDASKKPEAVQSSAAVPLLKNKHTTLWNAVTLTAQHYLPRLSGTFCPTQRAEPTVLSSLPLTPTRTPRKKQNEGQGRGLRLMVVLACVVTAGEA